MPVSWPAPEKCRNFQQIVFRLRRLNPVFRVYALQTALLKRGFLRIVCNRYRFGRCGRFLPPILLSAVQGGLLPVRVIR